MTAQQASRQQNSCVVGRLKRRLQRTLLVGKTAAHLKMSREMTSSSMLFMMRQNISTTRCPSDSMASSSSKKVGQRLGNSFCM